MDDHHQIGVAKVLLRALVRILGVDLASYDAEVAQQEAMTPEEREADFHGRLEAYLRERAPRRGLPVRGPAGTIRVEGADDDHRNQDDHS